MISFSCSVRFSENAGKDGMLSDRELDGHGFSESNQKFGGCLILKRKKLPIEDSELYYDRYGPSEMFKVSEDIVYVYAYHYPNSCIWVPDYFVLEDEEVKEGAQGELGAEDDNSLDSEVLKEDSYEWDEFGDMEDRSVDELDPGSWRKILEETLSQENISSTEDGLYISSVNKMMFAVSEGELELMKEAISNLHLATNGGYAHAQSTLGFLYEIRSGVEQSDAKAFLYHHFVAEGGNFQSKMALAYTYYRQQMYEKSVKLYAELASIAVASFLSFNESPLVEPVRINDGAEENKEALRKSRGEEDDDFQIIEYQAQKGSAVAMYKLGIFYR